MRKLLLACAALIALAAASPASAAFFNLSNATGTSPPYGEVTGQYTSDTSYWLHFNMNPEHILDTGAHYSLTLSLATGVISAASTTFAGLSGGPTPFTIFNSATPIYSNAPFGEFTNAVAGACGMGNSSGGCGGDLWISVTGVNPDADHLFNPATNLFNGQKVYAAVDIYELYSKKTFVAGLGDAPVIDPQIAAVPEPTTWAMMLIGFAGLSYLGVRRRRQALA
jgi:hypothetical protein